MDEGRRSEYLEAARRALPPLATLETFQDDAWGVLEGDADVEERFLQALGRYGHPLPDRRPADGLSGTVFGLGPDLLPQGRFGKLPLPHPRRCVLPLGRFALVATATLAVSNSQREAFLRLGELEQALARLREVESLLRDAAGALEGDDARLLESLDRYQPF